MTNFQTVSRAILGAAAAVLVGGLGLGLFVFAIFSAHEPEMTLEDRKNDLRTIQLMIENYQSIYGKPLPAYYVDIDGNPLYSWRVILAREHPDFSEPGFDFHYAWNVGRNRELAYSPPDVFVNASRFSQANGLSPYRAEIDFDVTTDVNGHAVPTVRQIFYAPDAQIVWSRPEASSRSVK